MADIIQIRRDTATQWNTVNPILAQGEVGLELDDSTLEPVAMKVGNSIDTWTALPYFFTSTDHFQFVQVVGTMNIIVNHLLAKRPSVTILDNAFNVVYADVEIPNITSVEINFSTNFTGYILLN